MLDNYSRVVGKYSVSHLNAIWVRKLYSLNWTLRCVIVSVKLCINVGNNEYITMCNFGGCINKAKKPGLKRVKIETMYGRSSGNV